MKPSKYGSPKNSGNSSIAPSQDLFGKTKSLRKKPNKPRGGQKGHKGSKLKMVPTPNVIAVHDAGQCTCCGNTLTGGPPQYDRRQVPDIPPITIQVTGHRRLHKTCGPCGKQNMGEFPKQLSQEAQYGTHLKPLCVYLQNYRVPPFARCSGSIADLTGHAISTGSPSGFQGQCSNNLQGYGQNIRQQLLQSPILHAGGTGTRPSGKNSWVHVMGNRAMSFFARHLNRGKQAMDAIGPLEHYNGALIHDRSGSYFSYNCGHGPCSAHIPRGLVHVEETFNAPWAKQIGALPIRAKNGKQKDPGLKASHYSRIFRQYADLIRPIIKNYDKTFKKTDGQRPALALEKHKYLFLKLIEQPDVPFDDNQAGRDLGMIKVRQKVSGCFRSQAHAQYFAGIWGYISTIKKNNQKVLENIQQAFMKNPFLPVMGE